MSLRSHASWMPPLFLLFSITPSLAQTILDPAILPACALTCPLLVQAQTACVPPAAPSTSQANYQSCFCQSPYLTTLYGSPSGICDSVCQPGDMIRVQNWYNGLCRAGVPTTLSTSAVGKATSTLSADSGGATVIGRPGQSGSSAVDAQNGSWISTHWRWILMLIIIFLGMIALSILGVWLKRHHRRKHSSNDFGPRDNFYPSNPHPGMQNVEARGVRPEMASASPRIIPPFAPAFYDDVAVGAKDKGKAKATVTAAPGEGSAAGGAGLAMNVKRKLSKRAG